MSAISWDAPAQYFRDLSGKKSDTVDLANRPRALWLGTGDIKMQGPTGDAVTLTIATAGPYALSPSRIWSTGTTATVIIGLY
jgi:hypothetical protein